MNDETIDNKKFALTNARAVSILVSICVAVFWVTRLYFKTQQNELNIVYFNERHDRKLKQERERNEFIMKIHSLEDELKKCKNE